MTASATRSTPRDPLSHEPASCRTSQAASHGSRPVKDRDPGGCENRDNPYARRSAGSPRARLSCSRPCSPPRRAAADNDDDKDGRRQGRLQRGRSTRSPTRPPAKGGTLKFVGTQDADSLGPAARLLRRSRGTSPASTRASWSVRRRRRARTATSSSPTWPTAKAEISRRRQDLHLHAAGRASPGRTATPVTSKDIKYGIERIWAQDVISGGPVYLIQVLDPKAEYKGPYKDKSTDKLGLKAIETPDDKTIIFKLPKPNGDFEQMLAMPAAGSGQAGARTPAPSTARSPFSSGPYKIESYTPGKCLTLVAQRQLEDRRPTRSARRCRTRSRSPS